jgi:hypothetical protein
MVNTVNNILKIVWKPYNKFSHRYSKVFSGYSGSRVFSGYSGFLPQGKLTGWVKHIGQGADP